MLRPNRLEFAHQVRKLVRSQRIGQPQRIDLPDVVGVFPPSRVDARHFIGSELGVELTAPPQELLVILESRVTIRCRSAVRNVQRNRQGKRQPD